MEKAKEIPEMNIALVTIAYLTNMVEVLVESASHTRHNLQVHLFLHSSNSQTVKVCERLARSANIMYYPYGTNRGVSSSWNEGILNAYASGADVVLVSNDDIRFSPGDVDRLAEKAVNCRDCYIISCAGPHERHKRHMNSHGLSCFAINPIAIKMIGCFDENFFPAYCEDADYAYRAGLAGLHEENCADTQIVHTGSATLFANPQLMRQNAFTHLRNLFYYYRKWGGDCGGERYRQPFDNPRFNHVIQPEQRKAPYGPEYDRRDRGIVRI